jgi:hypothetical protein
MSTLPQIPPGSTIRQNPDGTWSYRDGPHVWRPMPAPLTAAPWVVLEPAAPAPTTGTAMSTPKAQTDAAQAVYEAAHNAWVKTDDPSNHLGSIAAAALRAAAAQITAGEIPPHVTGDVYWPWRNGRATAEEHLLAIATELEGING